MTLLLLLLTAHFIGDFYLQPNRWIADRNQSGWRSAALYKHSAVHLLLSVGALYLASVTEPSLTAIHIGSGALVIAGSHLLIDWLKTGRHSTTAFIADQAAHIIVLGITAAWLENIGMTDIIASARALLAPDKLVYLLGYLLVLNPASILIAKMLARHTAVLNSIDNQSLGTAGRWIGYVERVLALSFILVDQYTGLGFLVATKTVFRVGDLSKAKDMRLTEYMMLGTLMSFATALIAGWIMVALISQ